ncbi:unnamed protein product (macronuclear) [Paramecium tetraurelia]|uniref:Armadillo-type fold n=1 Tax=Paramecium tetraurelia TaxID=5888 RepID=A0CA69_PARTE|nr:uncharacterized protein GSPATT00036466001 [Paramecium tetraurelia]CAK67686.1 unnamed protein product [Paramecium tetraurelia]|eukprot:XP_001435083.1 hypothetical protein (macronuclear) [Paramecium tetraurelia strain d4-2]
MDEQYSDLCELVLDQKLEVRKQALMLVLQYAQTEEDRKNFLQTNLVFNLTKLLGDEDVMTSVLSVIIQFAIDEFYQEQFLKLHTLQRVMEIIKEKMLNFYKTKQTNEQLELTIQLGLLALQNITQNEEAKEALLQLQFNDINRCFYFKLFCNFFVDERSVFMFANFKQVLLNVTSSSNVRSQLIKAEMKMMDFFCKLLETGELFAIQLFKNMVFEYEQQEALDQIIQLQFIDKAIDFLANDIVINHEFFDLEEGELAFQLAVMKLKKQFNKTEFQSRVQEAVKCLLIMTNIEPNLTKNTYNKARLDLIIRQLRKLQFVDKDQLDVIDTVYIQAQ